MAQADETLEIDHGLGALIAFLSVREDGAKATPKEVRAVFCPVCRECAPDPAIDLGAACARIGCHLEKSESWEQEDAFIRSALASTLFGDEPPPPEHVDIFNEHLALAACAIMALRFDEVGRLTQSFAPLSLRGVLHATLVRAAAYHAGERRVNIHQTSGAEAKAYIGGEREAFEQRRMQIRTGRAAHLRAEGRSDIAIARQMGVQPKTIRDWLGPRSSVS